jgi:hypothetical protein
MDVLNNTVTAAAELHMQETQVKLINLAWCWSQAGRHGLLRRQGGLNVPLPWAACPLNSP